MAADKREVIDKLNETALIKLSRVDLQGRVAGLEQENSLLKEGLRANRLQSNLNEQQIRARNLLLFGVTELRILTFNKYFKVPKFSGDYKKFREWWQMFDAHVHKKTIDPVEKYSLLKQSLEGRAAAEIAHLEFTADQYQVAMDAIAAKFGSAKDAEKEHVQQLQRLVLTRDLHIHDKFINFVSALSQNVEALISLGKNYDSLSLMLTPNILSALPVQMRESFNRLHFESSAKSDSDSDLELLLEFLDREVSIKRASRPLDSYRQQSFQSSYSNRDLSASNAARQQNQESSC
ncbi:uncharacterized protein LOC108864745 [Galendromus occidentalis]|uniref:Uncharacterized protein LOC108864745 n=1 Tax=Galendromus occidentalis TaxID=34638 RepID=A0AAJ7PAF4_9ACAR|nr:uncharacterized protein LOC108864745 [Galendromus occidentalis]